MVVARGNVTVFQKTRNAKRIKGLLRLSLLRLTLEHADLSLNSKLFKDIVMIL